MLQNSKVIRENEYTTREKILLLNTIITLKKLSADEELLQEVFSRSKLPKEEMLKGLPERLEVIQEEYTEESYGYTLLQALIDEMKGVA